jgi:hypothetical protein
MRISLPSRAACKRTAALCGIALPLVAALLWSLSVARGGELGWSPLGHIAPLLLGDAAVAAPPEPAKAPAAAVKSYSGGLVLRGANLETGDGWFGIGLRCSDCSMSRDDSTGLRVWHFRSAPEIRWIDPDSPADSAGVRAGDAIVEVDGIAITDREAGRRFGGAKPGEKLVWTVKRAGKEKTLTIVAAERPDDDERVVFHRELRDAQREMERAQHRLQEALSQLAEEHKQKEFQGLEETEERMERAQRQIERLMREYRAPRVWDRDGIIVLPGVPEPPDAPDAPAPPSRSRRQNVRYEADVGEFHVEVRSTGDVGVSENKDKSEIVIKTPDSTIRVRKQR